MVVDGEVVVVDGEVVVVDGAVVVVDGAAVGGVAVDEVSSTPSDVRTELARIAARIPSRSISRRVSACGHGTSCAAWMPSNVRAIPTMFTGAIDTGGRGIESERFRSSSTSTRSRSRHVGSNTESDSMTTACESMTQRIRAR